MAAVPWLARLPIELLERLRGLRLRPVDTRFGRQRYRAGFVARCPAEELAPFRLLERTVRETALERAAPPAPVLAEDEAAVIHRRSGSRD